MCIERLIIYVMSAVVFMKLAMICLEIKMFVILCHISITYRFTIQSHNTIYDSKWFAKYMLHKIYIINKL